MKRNLILLLLLISGCFSQQRVYAQDNFEPTYESSKPWVYWYWMHSAYSKEGVTADLEAMKEAGVEGAYLMSIKGPTDPPLIDPPILQLSDEWWDIVGFAIEEADRLDLQIAMHAADGFAVAGGPWIKPEQSMQKVVWSDTLVSGGQNVTLQLPEPEKHEDYYRDIAVFAFPVNDVESTSFDVLPKVTTTLENIDADFLTDPKQEGSFELKSTGWIQYEFEKPFTTKSITILADGTNYQAQRLKIMVSDDGINFRSLGRLEAPRHGWQDWDIPYTHSIEPVSAKYYRFVYDPEGSEPGAEDLDAAKWRQSLEIESINLSNHPKIGNYEGKSGLVWRISSETTQIQESDFVDLSDMINVSEYMDEKGNLSWKAPVGKWKIMRFGHTSTGQENETGGAGRGLEVDKFNPEAITFQFEQWFGKAVEVAGKDLVPEVLSILHIDSWEASSQNWSPVFREEFKSRRGYDIVDYLPVMAGIPIENSQTSEQVLYDVRNTISELITDHFFGIMDEKVDELGIKFSSENVAPTMVSDALLHFKKVDFPGGEFWLRSPTHDKPNDMLDAISAGHIYGKDIIQAEAFTQLRIDWDEHPGNLKALGDLHYALGVNRFFYHVFVHNPWLDRKPGMTLDNIGTYIQRDQTWWKPGKAWMDYCRRNQFQLQKGSPVVDLAVFTGEEIPSRAVLPDRLLPFIPNIFGKEKIESEKIRLENKNQPVAREPKEVTYSENMTDLTDWVNALNGYQYDSFNRDVLLNQAKVINGEVIFGGNNSYAALLFPDVRKMTPNRIMSVEVAEKILQLVRDGATVFIGEKPERSPGFQKELDVDRWSSIIEELWGGYDSRRREDGNVSWNLGKGRVIQLPYLQDDFKQIGIEPDVLFSGSDPSILHGIAWNHRSTPDEEIYFLSNQNPAQKITTVSFRIIGQVPYLYDPVTGETRKLNKWNVEDGRTYIPLKFYENESYFIVFKEKTNRKEMANGENWDVYEEEKTINEEWTLNFDHNLRGPKKPVKTDELFDWSKSENDSIRYYSGTVTYSTTFNYEGKTKKTFLRLDNLFNIASVRLNGKDCGVIWTYPYQIDISSALKKGENHLEIEVTNTWGNRLIGDQILSEEDRLTWRMASFRLEDEPLKKAGLLGPVKILRAK